ncbi:MAG: hypothetical protein IKR04_05650 [Clostridia bacterium]|nr:hypothetical protein [Clostridia bacterium]
MKKFALMLAIMMLSVCCSFAFADIIAPDSEGNDVDNIPLVISDEEGSGEIVVETEEQSGEVKAETEEVPESVEVESGEVTETEEASTGLEDGKGGNPIGGIIAIVVVLLLVVLIAFLNRG